MRGSDHHLGQLAFGVGKLLRRHVERVEDGGVEIVQRGTARLQFVEAAVLESEVTPAADHHRIVAVHVVGQNKHDIGLGRGLNRGPQANGSQ